MLLNNNTEISLFFEEIIFLSQYNLSLPLITKKIWQLLQKSTLNSADTKSVSHWY